MVIEGATSSLAEVNEFEAALKRASALASVEVKNTRAREGGATFQLSLTFRPGFQPTPATAPSAPAVGRDLRPARPGAGEAPMAGTPLDGGLPPSLFPSNQPTAPSPLEPGLAPLPGDGPIPIPAPAGSTGPMPLPPQP